MARQIAVSDEVYALLMGKKSDGKSFSDVIKAALTFERSKSQKKKSDEAGKHIIEEMERGYNLGKIIGTRSDWHDR